MAEGGSAKKGSVPVVVESPSATDVASKVWTVNSHQWSSKHLMPEAGCRVAQSAAPESPPDAALWHEDEDADDQEERNGQQHDEKRHEQNPSSNLEHNPPR